MSLPRWDDEMKFELLRLKSELKPDNFRVLHHPMGLGTVTKNPIIKPKSSSAEAPHVVANAQPIPPKMRSTVAQNAIPVPSLRRRQKPGFFRVLFVHLLDIVFVCLTLAIGVLLTVWVIDPQHFSQKPEILKQSIPIQYITKNNALALVAALYGFFSLYWLFFKLVSGSTLGESFLDNFRSLQNSPKPSRIKASGDS